MNNLRVGDKVTIKLFSGVIMLNAEITDIQLREQIIMVYLADSDLHFWVEFSDLLPPF